MFADCSVVAGKNRRIMQVNHICFCYLLLISVVKNVVIHFLVILELLNIVLAVAY